MADIEPFLIGAASGVNPTDSERSAAKRSHNHLRTILQTGQFERRIIDSFLSGSYSRDTAVHPLDDVDIIFIVDPSAWTTSWWASRPKPKVVLDSFARAIRYRYEQSTVRIQRRSVCLDMNHLAIDAVPAVETDEEDVLLIPDASADDWIKTAPKRHSAIAREVNKRCDGRFKPLVKLLKHWNHHIPRNAHTKSFAIETMAARLFDSVGIESLTDGALCFFDFLAAQAGQNDRRWTDTYGVRLNAWTPRVDDLAGSGSNVVGRLDGDRRDRLLNQAVRARDYLKKAVDARSVDSSERFAAKALLLT